MGKSKRGAILDEAISNARWILSPERETDEGDFYAVTAELAEQVLALPHQEYETKGYKILRGGRFEPGDELAIEHGIQALKKALAFFVAGGAPKTANRVRFALSSAKGARRNAGCKPRDAGGE